MLPAPAAPLLCACCRQQQRRWHKKLKKLQAKAPDLSGSRGFAPCLGVVLAGSIQLSIGRPAPARSVGKGTGHSWQDRGKATRIRCQLFRNCFWWTLCNTALARGKEGGCSRAVLQCESVEQVCRSSTEDLLVFRQLHLHSPCAADSFPLPFREMPAVAWTVRPSGTCRKQPCCKGKPSGLQRQVAMMVARKDLPLCHLSTCEKRGCRFIVPSHYLPAFPFVTLYCSRVAGSEGFRAKAELRLPWRLIKALPKVRQRVLRSSNKIPVLTAEWLRLTSKSQPSPESSKSGLRASLAKVSRQSAVSAGDQARKSVACRLPRGPRSLRSFICSFSSRM